MRQEAKASVDGALDVDGWDGGRGRVDLGSRRWEPHSQLWRESFGAERL